jgi:2,5-diamino-6-(ribosylamino)-4(3H)-pyrimidinone 5'-phosphate reductase
MKPQTRIQKPELPLVFINMAMTADGKIATANRTVHSFGSARDLEHVYELRATADAVMCGARTVEISQSILGAGGEKFRKLRLKNGLAEYNLRVIVSGSGSIDSQAEIFKKKFSPIIVLTTERASAKKIKILRGLADEVKVFGANEVDFHSALRWLRERWQVQRLLCEGGGELNDALFRAGLVDEINLTICPKIFGGRTAPTIADGLGFTRLSAAEKFELTSIKRKKGELFTVFSHYKNKGFD